MNQNQAAIEGLLAQFARSGAQSPVSGAEGGQGSANNPLLWLLMQQSQQQQQQQQQPQPQPQQQPAQAAGAGNVSSIGALLMQHLKAAGEAALSGAKPATVLPIQGVLPYGKEAAGLQLGSQSNASAAGALLLPVPGQAGDAAGRTDQTADASGSGAKAGGAAGGVLPAQAWQAYPKQSWEAHNATEADDLYQSKGALDKLKGTGVNLTRYDAMQPF